MEKGIWYVPQSYTIHPLWPQCAEVLISHHISVDGQAPAITKRQMTTPAYLDTKARMSLEVKQKENVYISFLKREPIKWLSFIILLQNSDERL